MLGKVSNGTVFKYKASLGFTDSENGSGMAVAILRVPSCLALNFDLIEKMRDNGEFDMYEVRKNNSELVLYWRALRPDFAQDLTFEFLQTYEAELCQQQLHTAYLYYVEEEIIICPVGE